MSATMQLLKGGKPANAKPADKLDEELASPAEETAAEETSDEAEKETVDEPEVEAEAGDEAPVGVTIPTSKTEVHALKADQVGPVHAALSSPIPNFDDLSLKAKKDALLNHLFPAKKGKVSANDPLVKIAGEIEQLADKKAVEQRLRDLEAEGGMNDFRKGGLLHRLNELGDFGEHKNFADYVKAEHNTDYRTARYLMTNYTGLLELGIPAEEVAKIGWTKLNILLKGGVMTTENYAEWRDKALAMNVPTLQAAVDEAAAAGSPGAGSNPPAQTSEVKSKTFKLMPDQVTTVNEAIAKAKKNGSTDSDAVALDYICVEYLGTTAGKKSPPKAADVVAPGYDEDNLDVEAFLTAIRNRFPDDGDAMTFLFSGKEGSDKTFFEELFPKVEISVNIP